MRERAAVMAERAARATRGVDVGAEHARAERVAKAGRQQCRETTVTAEHVGAEHARAEHGQERLFNAGRQQCGETKVTAESSDVD